MKLTEDGCSSRVALTGRPGKRLLKVLVGRLALDKRVSRNQLGKKLVHLLGGLGVLLHLEEELQVLRAELGRACGALGRASVLLGCAWGALGRGISSIRDWISTRVRHCIF